MNVLLETLVEETDLSKPEIEERIEEKMKEFSGLVSKEGALHLVANDLGVEFDEVPQQLQIDQIVPDMPQVDIAAKVVSIEDPTEFERDDGETGHVQNIVLGDETGTIRLALWDDQLEVTDNIDEGDVLRFENAYTVEGWQDKPELRIGRQTRVERTDDEIEAKEEPAFTGEQRDYEHAQIGNITTPGQYYAVRGTVLAVYGDNATYTICEECGNTATKENGTYMCDEHGEITGENALALSTIIDDGTGNLRCVFFRDRARQLLGIDEDTEITDETAADKAEAAIGEEIQVKGFVKENDYFDRLELIVSTFSPVDLQHVLTKKLEAVV